MDSADSRQLDRPSAGTRFLLAVMALGLSAGFVLACYLKPDARGYGTHRQLGLPECQLRQYIGVSCPHCGMTTCFSNLVRGDFRAAWRANPAGIPLAFICACCIPLFTYVALAGKWLFTDEPFRWMINVSLGYMALALMTWILRILY